MEASVVVTEDDAKYKALMLSIYHPLSGAFLSAMPRPETSFTSDEFKMACWARLLYPFPLISDDTLCDCRRKVPLGKFGEHVAWCAIEGNVNYRHNALCGHLKYLMQQGVPKRVISEPKNFYVNTSARDLRRPDLVVFGMQKYKSNKRETYKDVAVDVSVTYPLSKTALKNGSAMVAMSAAQATYNEKMKHYAGPSKERKIKFVPMIFESFGAIHHESERLLRHLLARASMLRGIPASTFHTYWYRRLSCTIQLINAQTILGKIYRLEEMNMSRSCYGSENVDHICWNDPTLNNV